MLKSIILSTLLVSGSLFASDLKAEFTDAKWDGMTVPKDEVCSNFNESKIGSTPPLKVSNIVIKHLQKWIMVVMELLLIK